MSSLVLIWVCFSQFPIPIVHSHATADEDFQLAAHLDLKHKCAEVDSECLHWHLLMPWEVVDDDDGEPGPHPSPLGMWGAEGMTMIQAPLIDVGLPISFDVPVDATAELAFSPRTGPVRPAGDFLNTYSGVPRCALLCVSLR
ncbi:MAG: hypothetical protein ACR2NZ_09315 [Rubripirellula sp.]